VFGQFPILKLHLRVVNYT